MAKFKNFIMQALLTLGIYLGLAVVVDFFFLPLFCIIIIILDTMVYKRTRVEGLYFTIPILALMLLIFDLSSIFRSLQFIVTLTALYGMRFVITSSKYRVFFSLIFIFFIYYIANPNWMQYYQNRRVSKEINNLSFAPNDLKLHDLENNTVVFNKNETYLLDFWFTRCGECFTGMEEFKQWSEKNPNRKGKIILVNVLLKNETFEENIELVKKYGFKNLYTKLSFNELRELGITEYPMHVIIKNNKIKFIGVVATEPNIFYRNFSDFLN